MTHTPSHSDGALTEVEFATRDPAYFFVGLSASESCHVQLEEEIRLGDGTIVEFFTGWECSRAAVREHAEDTHGIDSARIITAGSESLLFRIVVSGACVVKTIESEGAIPGTVTATDGDGHVTAHVPRDVDERDVADAVRDAHPSMNLVAQRQRDATTPVFTPWGVRQVLQERLTDRQWEVLRTAYRQGYFDRPREHTGEEVADVLGISSATFSQHLQAGLHPVLSAAMDADGEG